MERGIGSTIITINGVPFEIKVALSFDDIDANGVAWCEPVRALIAKPEDSVRLLGTLVVIAAICRDSGRLEEAFGALRMARRMANTPIHSIDGSIANLLGELRPLEATSKAYEIISYDSEPNRFMGHLKVSRIYESIYHPGLPYGGLLGIVGYEPCVKPISVDNLSFHVIRQDRIVATVPLLVYADHVGSWVRWVEGMPGMPVEINYADHVPERHEINNVIATHLVSLARRYSIRELLFQSVPNDGASLARALGRRFRYSAELWDRPIVDLTLENDLLFKDVRKSYKASINWGMRNLRMEYLSGSMLDDIEKARVYSLFRTCQADMYAHFGDAFSRQLFDEALHMCTHGSGEVAISYELDNSVCGVVISSDAGGKSYYALGGSRVVEGRRSPSHWLVYNAIQRAKVRGNREYHLGRLFGAPISVSGYATRIMSKREIDVSFFKHGFSERSDLRYVYRFVTGAIGG
ncbi:MAG: GNAT family N-acetyltransferase [Candidatus Eremiobacteraeota bacterium]|nr:GNAT family N-acetyltransferase [Candidatus Eremiobacteraeota bacterium]